MLPISFTKITSSHGPLTKTMSLDADSKIHKTASAQLRHGTFETVAVPDLNSFAQHLESATPDVAFCYGTPDKGAGIIVRESDLATTPGAIARTRESMGFATKPGILMLDNDNGEIFRDSLAEFLWETVDLLDGVSMLARPSSSSNLWHSGTGKCLRPMVNQRAYLVVSDASQIPALGKFIEAELWLSGHGYYDISSAGSLLKRCTVDTSVWQPERLDFVGGAVCTPPLEQRDMSCKLIDGYQPMLDVRTLRKLSKQQEIRIAELEQRAKAEVEDERKIVRAAWTERRVGDLVNKGVSPDLARQSVHHASELRTLNGAFVIVLENGTELQVAELLSDPSKYHGQRCHDPLEPDYHDDPRVGYINITNGGRPYIYSHAHGGCRYTLQKPPNTIQILTGESARCTDEISKYLADQGEVYERGQVLLDVNQDGQTKALNTAAVKYLAGSSCNLVRFDSKAKVLKPTDLTDTVAQLIIGRAGHGVFRKLSGIITAPTMTKEGRVISSPGYDNDTGLLLLNGLESSFPTPIKRPNTAQLQTAFSDLWYPVKDFPFQGDSSRSSVLAALLTAVVRPCLITAPAFGFDAPTQGAGKTKLAQCVAALATGRIESLSPPPSTEDETRKNLATALAKTRAVLVLDNMESQLKSAVLAAFLTAPTWSDRLLGGNTDIESANRMLVLITGNNLAPVGDIVRRLLTIRIDPQLEASEVWKREFALDPLDYIVRNRQRLVAAALTILSGYVAAGRPKMAPGRLASFEQWDDMVRQPIVWLGQQGIAGLCDPTVRLSEAAAIDPDAMRLASLTQQWHTVFGSAPQALAAVVNRSELYAELKEVAPDRQGFINVRVLAAYLRKRIGKIVDGHHIERVDGRSNTSLWRVVATDAADISDGGFGGFDGSVLAHPAIHIKNINSKSSIGTKTDPSKPPKPPSDALPEANIRVSDISGATTTSRTNTPDIY
jgi:hypothetical protein